MTYAKFTLAPPYSKTLQIGHLYVLGPYNPYNYANEELFYHAWTTKPIMLTNDKLYYVNPLGNSSNAFFTANGQWDYGHDNTVIELQQHQVCLYAGVYIEPSNIDWAHPESDQVPKIKAFYGFIIGPPSNTEKPVLMWLNDTTVHYMKRVKARKR